MSGYTERDLINAHNGGYHKGQRTAVCEMRKLLLEKSDDVSCSVSVFAIEDVYEEMVRRIESEYNRQ